MHKIKLSVHQLVDFVLRKGDIDSRVFNQTTMQEGTKLHSIYQSKQGNNYLKEVALSYVFEYGDYSIELSGRADGIILDEVPLIDEIKTTNTDLEEFYNKNKDWHLGQAICYAYIYLKQKNLDYIGISLTYISQVDNSTLKKIHYFKELELIQKINEYFKIYLNFQNVLERNYSLRNNSLKDLKFPFETIRNGQEKMIETTIESLDGEISFIEASTGIGKTMSTIYGSLYGFKKNKIDKVFYLTAKNSGFINSFHAFNILQEKGYSFNVVELISKEKMCPHHGEKNCNPIDCPLAAGYYDKIQQVLLDLISKEKIITNKIIKKYAKESKICPFELSLDASLYTDFIVCDYNYVFHPISQLKRYFENPDKQYRMFALIDEAHNLLNRARDMFSASFSSLLFDEMKKVIELKCNKKIEKTVKEISKYVKKLKKYEFGENSSVVLDELDESFINHLKSFNENYKNFKLLNPKFKLEEADKFSRENFKFLKILEMLNVDYKITLKKEKDGVILTLYCLNPAPYLNDRIHSFEGAVIFSATLSPLDYYQKVLFGRSNFKSMRLKSPFPKENLKILLNNKLSLKYKDRLLSFSEIKKEIITFIDHKIGNYIVFAPSYEYLNLLKRAFIKDERFIFQDKTMTNELKNDFLDEFIDNPDNSKVGVCVLGGSFSEGIDLVGNRLIGVVVIGVGMPSLSFENGLIKDFYNENNVNGFEYTYINPGITKVMQAVGRLIRTENDKGVALLIDNRYLTKNYSVLFKNNWENVDLINDHFDLENKLTSFYKN